jgi:hypothetical protein
MKKLRDILEQNYTLQQNVERLKNMRSNTDAFLSGKIGLKDLDKSYGTSDKPVINAPSSVDLTGSRYDLGGGKSTFDAETPKAKIGDIGISKATNPVNTKLEPKVGSLVAPQSGYPAAEKPKAPIPKAREQDTLVIKDKDKIWNIAGGDPKRVKEILKLNPGLNPNKIPIGYKLKLK